MEQQISGGAASRLLFMQPSTLVLLLKYCEEFIVIA